MYQHCNSMHERLDADNQHVFLFSTRNGYGQHALQTTTCSYVLLRVKQATRKSALSHTILHDTKESLCSGLQYELYFKF